MHRERKVLCVVVAAVCLGVACSGDDDDETINSIVENIEEAVATAVTEAEEAARTAVSEVEAAVDEAATDAAETAVRNLVAEQGEQEFADSGNPIDDEGLTCEATASEDLDSIQVDCTGTTVAGEQAQLIGETAEFPGESLTAVEGTFTGTVDGAEAFTTDTLGG